MKHSTKSFDHPVEIKKPNNQSAKSSEIKTWTFAATNVRDFAFASSRKFIWDAMAVKQTESPDVMAMSLYPSEANPLWSQYSTKSVAHALKWYSHYTFDYPYPVAWSIHTDRIGMEYPMICFNGRRPEKDGTYSERTKYGLISVIIHEVGHNYFPMIVNSDERQWTWMDEGLCSFVQFLTEQQWERDYPSRRGPAHKIAQYMGGNPDSLSPIMTNSESIWQFGNNAYAKPATALNILRETVMGPELFDFAFKEYARRWKFKHPSPADFFRTMEDASAVDLDWFWRGWFYTTDHVDLSIKDFKWFKVDAQDNQMLSPVEDWLERYPNGISSLRNRERIVITQEEIDTTLNDFYSRLKQQGRSASDPNIEDLTDEQLEIVKQDQNYYEITFENNGGLVMPIILQFQYTDGTKEDFRIPAEIWRKNSSQVTKVFPVDKVVELVILDPYLETADTDLSGNTYPRKQQLTRFELFKQKQQSTLNRMQKSNKRT